MSSFIPLLSALLADCPAPLVSSDRSVSVPVEASIEDLHDIQYETSMGSLQTDAKVVNSSSALDEKLQRELQYHKFGSYNCESQPDPAANCYNHVSLNPFLPNNISTDHNVRQPEQDKPCTSTVHSWTKAEPVQPTSQEEAWYRPTSGLYESMNSTTPTPLPMSPSTHSLPQLNQQHPHSHYDRQQSWPISDLPPGHLLSSSKSCMQPDPGTKF